MSGIFSQIPLLILLRMLAFDEMCHILVSCFLQVMICIYNKKIKIAQYISSYGKQSHYQVVLEQSHTYYCLVPQFIFIIHINRPSVIQLLSMSIMDDRIMDVNKVIHPCVQELKGDPQHPPILFGQPVWFHSDKHSRTDQTMCILYCLQCWLMIDLVTNA